MDSVESHEHLYSEKELKAVQDLYQKNGVGDTYAHKLAFWNNNQEAGNIYIMGESNPSDRQLVAVHEITYLTDLYPEDYPLY